MRRKRLRSAGDCAQSSLYRVFLPVAIGQVLASAETLKLKDEFQQDGLLRGVCAQQYQEGTLKRRLASILDSPITPKALAVANLAASAGLIIGRRSRNLQIAASVVIAASNRLSELRTPYGRDGADQMTSVITQYRALSALIPDSQVADEVFLRSVNFQAGLSYAVSGISKAFGSSWVQGDALGEVLQTEAYGRGPAASILRRMPRVSRFLTVGTVIWELAFPLIYLVPQKQARIGLAAVKLFHVAVAATMELPRFVWGFFGSHGAVRHVIDRREGSSFIEKAVIGTASAVAVSSAIVARENRKAVTSRRLGPKGGAIIDSNSGTIEYQIFKPEAPEGECVPTILLESGLGEPIESWEWIARDLSKEFAVIRYHRSGYGLTKSQNSPADILAAILEHANVQGEVIPVTHSIGSLFAATYVKDQRFFSQIRRMVIIDGTDPSHLETDRSSRKTLGKFLQAQLHTMFASITGLYKWAPNATERQAGYTPNVQFSYLHSVFSPPSVLNAVREYLRVPTDTVIKNLSQVSSTLVLGSGEYAAQQDELAQSLGASFKVIPASAHKSILGKQKFALAVTEELRRFIHAT